MSIYAPNNITYPAKTVHGNWHDTYDNIFTLLPIIFQETIFSFVIQLKQDAIKNYEEADNKIMWILPSFYKFLLR